MTTDLPDIGYRKVGLLLAAILLWKFLLFALAGLPLPANDSYFYDGAVVNHLRGGGYFNPTISHSFPISGSEVFSAYPPLHQLAMLGWMQLFGVSAMSSMGFHQTLFGCFAVLVVLILRSLQVPSWAALVSVAFLPAITFHDRPDSIATVLGTFAILSWVRARQHAGGPSNIWWWACAGALALLCTSSLQCGLVYLFVFTVGLLSERWLAGRPLPLVPMTVAGLIVVGLIATVRFGFPHLWAGFQEHAGATPSITGLRAPRLFELLKVVRSIPGALFAAMLLVIVFRSRDSTRRTLALAGAYPMLGLAAGVALLAFGSLLFFTANWIGAALYLQPLLIGLALVAVAELDGIGRFRRALVGSFVLLALISNIRAVGLTTWGVACARDVGRSASLAMVDGWLAEARPGEPVIVSSAYLYSASARRELKLVHSDWLALMSRGLKAEDIDLGRISMISREKPRMFVVTQFDYFRFYQGLVERVRALPGVRGVTVEQTAQVPAPDSFKATERVVQHVSWAPVLIRIDWGG